MKLFVIFFASILVLYIILYGVFVPKARAAWEKRSIVHPNVVQKRQWFKGILGRRRRDILGYESWFYPSAFLRESESPEFGGWFSNEDQMPVKMLLGRGRTRACQRTQPGVH